MTLQLDQAGEEAFAELEQDEEATEEDFINAEMEFYDEHRSDLETLKDTAPDEIRDDVNTLVEALLQVAEGNLDARASEEAQAAEQRIIEFEEESCGESSGS